MLLFSLFYYLVIKQEGTNSTDETIFPNWFNTVQFNTSEGTDSRISEKNCTTWKCVVELVDHHLNMDSLSTADRYIFKNETGVGCALWKEFGSEKRR